MEFRPCIDIHNGKVKQIVGSSLKDEGNMAKENFVSDKPASYYAKLYMQYGLKGGHVIMLNATDSEYYQATRDAAMTALCAYPQGLQVGGGINDLNAEEFIAAGASHVIVTSYAFKDAVIRYDNLERLKAAVGREHIVLDLSCRRRGDSYYVVTDRWQKFTEAVLNAQLLDELSSYCDEFLVHAADVEGKSAGIDIEVLKILAETDSTVTYAGGISSIDDIRLIREMTGGSVNITVGSRLDIFGGDLSMEGVLECIR